MASTSGRSRSGRDDRFFPVALQRRVARDRVGVEADVLPGGHLLPLAQPRQVADYLLETQPPTMLVTSTSISNRANRS